MINTTAKHSNKIIENAEFKRRMSHSNKIYDAQESENIFQIVYEYNKGVLMGCSENLGIFFGACA
ncbi:MAG: hypothetical protein KAJ18_11645 [Candidatus Omnitrophica bacterium]|nr:hypothetical protein [Candidatus Omnitrophota bacterium]